MIPGLSKPVSTQCTYFLDLVFKNVCNHQIAFKMQRTMSNNSIINNYRKTLNV